MSQIQRNQIFKDENMEGNYNEKSEELNYDRNKIINKNGDKIIEVPFV